MSEPVETLREFALQMLEWAADGVDPDGSDIQCVAERLGLLVKVPFDPAKHTVADWLEGEIEPGDDYFEHSAILRKGAPE